LIGGKWTTFRAFAELVGDQILQQLGRPRIASSTDRPIAGEPPTTDESEATLQRMLRNEAVVHLDDLLIRRTALGLYTRWSEARLAAIADLAARELGWSGERRDAEVGRSRDLLARVHGVAIAP
jgi:glycerol-3-phosphate dehydrogenase